MTRKQLTINIIIAVLVVSVVGGGAVTMSALAAEGTDDNDSRESATEMATNSTETGALGADDVDWYAFEVSVGEQINAGIDLGSDDTTLSTNTSAEFDLYGPSGEEVSVYPNDMMGAAYRPNPGSPSQAWGGLVAEQSGTYYVRVTGKNISDYNVSVSTKRLDQYDPNEQPSSATQIESGDTVSAVMSGQDVDTYAIDLDKGETINASAQADSTGLVNIQLVSPATPDTTDARYNREHDVLNESYDNQQFNYTASESGTYFIRVYPFENGIGSFGAEVPYELSVTGSGADGTDGSSDENQNDSGASDGTATTPDDTDSTDGTAETPGDTRATDENASTGAPDTDGTEQSDSEETGDDAESDADTDTQADDNEQTSQSGPGFTGAGAVVGLFVTALFALRRQ